MSCLKPKKKRSQKVPELYTYRPNTSYKYSPSHDVHTTNPRMLLAIPPPRPPVRKTAEVIDASDFPQIDDRAIKVPLTILTKPLTVLIDYLVQSYHDDMSKVRVLYRWLTNQPIHRMNVLNIRPKTSASALHHLWLLKNKKQRYADVFSTMCRQAEIYCVTIHGAIKGTQYEIGERIDIDKHYGEWNAVFVEGDWRFIDTLWGTCDIKDPGDGKGRFQCDERFFLPEPKDFIYTHYSASPRWQLLDTPKSLEGFEESACLKNRFFDLGMTVLSHPMCEVQCPEGELDFLFGLESNRKGPERAFKCYISHYDKPETKKEFTNGIDGRVPVFIHRLTESSVAIKVRFPERGIFKVEIVGKEVNIVSPYKDFDWVAIYKVFVDDPAMCGFPKIESIGWGPGKDVMKIGLAAFNYSNGIIVARNAQTKIRFKILDTNQVQNMKFFFTMTSTHDNPFNVNSVSDRFDIDGNIMTFFIDAPPLGEYLLKMYARNVRGCVTPDQNKEINICNYLFISDIPQLETSLGILTERTEIEDDFPYVPALKLNTTPRKPQSEPASSVVSSIVSASNVVMDTAVDNEKQRQTHGRVATSPNSKSFLEKRESFKSNRVVPLTSIGADDGSILLAPDDKPNRLALGLQRQSSLGDDSRIHRALAVARKEKTSKY